MTNFAGIVRWLPLVVVTAACSADGPTAPEGVDASLLVTAQAKGGNGNDTKGLNGRWGEGSNAWLGQVALDEQRVWHVRYYPAENPAEPGRYRMCQLNPLENTDGNDWSRTSGKLHIVEQNAFVLIKEFQASADDVEMIDGVAVGRAQPMNHGKWELTHLGRAQWSLNSWLNTEGEGEISRRSQAKGVVARVPAGLLSEADVQGDQNTGAGGLWDFTYGHDLRNSLFQAGANWPNKIDALLLAAYEADALLLAECDVDVYFFVVHNEVKTYEGNIPGGLLQLIPGAK